MAQFNDGIYNLLQETNYSATPAGVDVWTGKNPFIGCKAQFPPPSLKERADISYTNNQLFDNNLQEVYNTAIDIFRDISPFTGMPIHEIICGLPYFRNIEQYWQALIASNTPIVEHVDRQVSKKLADVMSKSNFPELITTEISARMRDVISAYKVSKRSDGSIYISKIDVKNFIPFLSASEDGIVEVVLYSNVFDIPKWHYDDTLPPGRYIQFIEYHRNGLIREYVCDYTGNVVGDIVTELMEEQAFKDVPVSPIVIFKHNTAGNQLYGTDQYRYMASSVAGALRSLQNLLRLGELLRERLWYGSDKLVSKNPNDGGSAFLLNGFAGIPEGVEHTVTPGYVEAKVPIEKAVEVFNKCIKSIAIDSKLGMVFFDIEKLGSNLSAKSIIAAMYPTQLEAKRVAQEMTRPVLEVVQRVYLAATGDLLNLEDLSITWFDGLPVDEKEFTETIQSRIGKTLTLEQAISRLDKVSSAVAYDRAEEIRRQRMVGFIGNMTLDENDLTDEDAYAELDIDTVDRNFEPDIDDTPDVDDSTGEKAVSVIAPILTQSSTDTSSLDKPKVQRGRFTRPSLRRGIYLPWQFPFGVRNIVDGKEDSK